MAGSVVPPSAGALEEVRRIAGRSAAIVDVAPLEGGQHAHAWRVDTTAPPFTAVVRQFPPGDGAAGREQRLLGRLDGLGGMAPVVLAADLDGRWSAQPTSVLSWIEGAADITPQDPHAWARELGRGLALVHAVGSGVFGDLPSVLDGRGSAAELHGPLAAAVRSRWVEIAAAPEVLSHCDYWSGNVVWRDGALAGIVDWSGAARGPRAFDLGWCRLDLVLLHGEPIADVFLAAYEAAAGERVGDPTLCDSWALGRSHEAVETWAPNYAPLGRGDLNAAELRRRHALWTQRLLEGR